ncbi:MAG TPA: hypothetical protein VM925_28785, partial [Labilithrix sp.]|nr:hypothetical protein [Labilithrix sp.]
MITLQLTQDDARFLCTQLERQLAHIDDELVHTDKREMQRELARDVARLRSVLGQLTGAAQE